ncbi:MAG TPA: hypothetical protein VMF11_01175 [Candidatus Baltobacteraceae bacterium]|nr:hypothetical protein [Candidatus Baltobacteraceae bacterium]
MSSWVNRALRVPAAAAAFISLAIIPAIALAQPMPSYAVAKVETIKGTISSFNGATTMYVRDVHGYIDDVTLHQGTIINPTGIRLQPGYPVTITGRPDGRTFIADEIDTPFRSYYGYAYPYYGPLYAYPPYSLRLGFGWGWGGGWGRWRP